MDKATLLGLSGALFAVIFGIVTGGGQLSSYFDIPSVIITVVGTIMSTIGANSLYAGKKIVKVMKVAFVNKIGDPATYVSLLISLSEKARREGLLSLEDEVEGIEDRFLQSGMRLVIDGAEPNSIKSILHAEVAALDARHTNFRLMVEDMAGFAPAFGMIGTLIGLVVMMRSMGGDPAGIGKGMAAALITTFYGSVMANCIFMPIGAKLSKLNSEELVMKDLIIEGVLSIQAGDNPKTLQSKLLSYFDPDQRVAFETQGKQE